MACLYFVISEQGKWPYVSAWWLKPCSLMGWLYGHWILSYYSTFWCYFPSVLSVRGCLPLSPCVFIHWYIQAHQILLPPGQPNLAPEEYVQSCSIKVENLSFSVRALIKPSSLFQNVSTWGTEACERSPHIFVGCWNFCSLVLHLIINHFSHAYTF